MECVLEAPSFSCYVYKIAISGSNIGMFCIQSVILINVQRLYILNV